MSFAPTPESFLILNLLALANKYTHDNCCDEESDEDDDAFTNTDVEVQNMLSPSFSPPLTPESHSSITSFVKSTLSGGGGATLNPSKLLSSPSLHSLLAQLSLPAPLTSTIISDLSYCITSPDSLLDRFAHFERMLSTTIDRGGMLGVHIRQQVLGFQKLSFETMTLFFESLGVYLDDYFFTGDSDDDGNDNDNDNDNDYKMDGGSYHRHFPSTDAMHSKITSRIFNLERTIGTESFESVDSQIASLLNYHPELALAHFLRYLNCFYHNELVEGE